MYPAPYDQDQLPFLFASPRDRGGLLLCQEAWRFCSCDACHARRLYYGLFGIPPLSTMATSSQATSGYRKKIATLPPTKSTV